MMDKRDSKLSIMIIPKTKKVKRFTIPNWLPKSILIYISVIFIIVILFFNRRISLNSKLKKDNLEKANQITAQENKINILKEIHKEKDLVTTELETKNENLNKKVNEVEIKLEQIDKLKKQLESMASTNN